MSVSGGAAPQEVRAYLSDLENKGFLRFITCGSVDDGKSTLIGRLLFESKLLFDDQLARLEADSKRVGTQGENLDFALLVDGLAAEREQGITIDVAYRFFSTGKRKFIVADTPGHEQYTRNMATGASTASLAVLMIDARKGVLTQTRRHSFIVNMLGVKHLVLAVNKMDLVDYGRETFERIVSDYLAFAQSLGLSAANIQAIPLSALAGDNVVENSANMTWYHGPSLLHHLETVDVEDRSDRSFRMPVQWVNRPNSEFRGFSGLVTRGAVQPGDAVKVLPAGKETKIARIVTADGDLERAVADQSVTLTFADEIDASRGDVLCAAGDPAEVADQFETKILWMAEEELLPGRTYLMKIGTRSVQATVSTPKYGINVNTLEHVPAKVLKLNEIGICNIALNHTIAFDPYEEHSHTGGFILIDRITNHTVAMGTINFALRRSQNIHWQALEVSKEARADQKAQKPAVLWFTGLSGSGKSTVANLVEKRLFALNKHTVLLDGDNVRHGLNRDLGFTEADRVENIRRVAEVSKLMTEAGLIALVAFISPFRSERRMARELMGEGEFIEIHIHAPLEVAEQRDVKGLYAKAREGKIKNFTGIDSPFEEPEKPELRIDTTQMSAEEAAEAVLALLTERGIIR